MRILCLLISAFLTCAQFAAAKSPNIILIMADDIGYECFGCYGSEQYKTPNIDRMASQGLRFQHCYSQPLCTPSRVKIMTGISNVRNYAAFSILRRDQKTFGHYLKEAGYQTVIGGKWQLFGAENYAERFRGKGSLPEQMGFDRHCLWQVKELGDRFWNPKLTIDGKTNQFAKDDYGPDHVNQYLLDFMENHAGDDAPMLIYYPMILVHNPFLPTPDSVSRSEKDKQKNFEDMVAYMDKMVGRVVDKTQQLGIAENTLILFTGDNGTNKLITSRLGDRDIRGGKGNTSDSGTREPLIAWWPGTTPAGVVTDQLVDFSDFLPTMLQVAGAQTPSQIDGISFAPLLKGSDAKTRQWMHCFYHPRPEKGEAVQFVRNQEWKLYQDGRFFHVSNDVDEKKPLDKAAAPGQYAALRKALDSFPSKGQMLLKFD
ncbi:MAG: sulfatase-like hydrolase/transferase [Planctomycetales bacterium]|nr:sulfatase-like hydrolase/transferase [Planctomycetales bacterium]